MHVYLETDRLLLRRFTQDDVDHLVALDSDPEVLRFVTGGPPTPREEIEQELLPAFLRHYERGERYGFWAAIEKSTGEFLGWFHFRHLEGAGPDDAELGYRLRRAAWGRGYGTEGARALVRKGFTELGVRRVVASAAAANTASRRVMEKAGLSLVRTYRMVWPGLFDGVAQEDVEYALEKADWERQEATAGGPSLSGSSRSVTGS
jgi:RimJ/RimL family protein N-acetyltransferase